MKYIVYANVIVALSSGLLCAGFSYRLGIEKWYLYGLFALFSTLAVYNGQRLFKSEQKNKTPWLQWVKRNEKRLFLLVVFSSLISVAILIAIQKFDLTSLILLGVSGVISFFYVIKVAGRNMREIPFIKIHLIAITWSVILIVFPAMNEGLTNDIWWVAGAHYFYVLGVAIPFDIRDMKYDDPKQKTVPQMVGVMASRIIALFAIVLFALMLMYVDERLMYNPLFYLAVFLQMTLVLIMNEKRSDIYCAGGIDGAIALLGLSYFVL